MTNEQILKKAIEKAVKGGWKAPQQLNYFLTGKKKINIGWEKAFFITGQYYCIIFSHDFAKAFWGNGHFDYYNYNGRYSEIKPEHYYGRRISDWQYYLQQMVLEKSPLKYLEKFL